MVEVVGQMMQKKQGRGKQEYQRNDIIYTRIATYDLEEQQQWFVVQQIQIVVTEQESGNLDKNLADQQFGQCMIYNISQNGKTNKIENVRQATKIDACQHTLYFCYSVCLLFKFVLQLVQVCHAYHFVLFIIVDNLLCMPVMLSFLSFNSMTLDQSLCSQYISYQIVANFIIKITNKIHPMQPEIKSFRLTTKKKHSIRSYSQEKAESSSSEQSSFSVQYHSLTKRLKIKANQIRQAPLGSTVSSFGGLNSFRIRTQTSAFRSLHKKHESGLVQFSMSDKKQRVQKSPQNFRYSTNILKETKGLKLTSQNFKCRKNFKIQRPSIYWQIPQQDNEISLFKQSKQNKTKNTEQLQFSSQNNIPKQKLLQNCILLWKIRKQISSKSNKVKPKDVIKAIKAYIMRKQTREDPSNSMEKIFKNVDDQNDYKEILACQRIILIGVVELINAEKLHYLCVQSTYILDNLIGFYLFLLGQLFQKSMFQTGSEQLNKLQQQAQAEGIQHKSSLTSTLLFLCTKLQTVFRYSSELLKRIKGALSNAKKASINRTFYDILTIFAVYLNQAEGQKAENQYLSKYIASFLTCPSPFIIQPRSSNKNYTLVIDLDETICHTKLDSNNASKYGTIYRPFCTQFFKKVSEKYQIIIFTSSISSYAEQVIAPFFDYVAHILCREHTTKIKGGPIKDLSRIGRSLETTLMVDNIADNFKLQTENGILVNSWYGQKNDRQLQKLEQILLKVVAENPKDIRQQLKRVLSQKQ